MRTDRAGCRGFTLIETIIVLVVLGLMATLVISHRPMHSRTVDLRSAATRVVQAMRTARSAAVATDQPQLFSLSGDPPGFRVGAGRPQALPRGVTAVLTIGGRPARGVAFLPDGSSSGGSVVLASGDQHVVVGVSWLSGRIGIATPAQ